MALNSKKQIICYLFSIFFKNTSKNSLFRVKMRIFEKQNEIMIDIPLYIVGSFHPMTRPEPPQVETIPIECPPNLGSYSGSLFNLTDSIIDPKKHLNNIISKRKTKRK